MTRLPTGALASRKEKYQILIWLLAEVNAIQQELIENPDESYQYHNKISNLAFEFEDRASDEGLDI